MKHPFTSQQEVFLYIPAKSPLFHLKVRIGLSQIKDAIKTFPALDETLYLHADRALYKTPGGLFIYIFYGVGNEGQVTVTGFTSLV